MKKVLLTILIVLSFLLSLCMYAYAETPTNVIEDFEDDILSSEILITFGTTQIVENEGKGGSRGLKVDVSAANNAGGKIKTKTISMLDTEDRNIVMSYDIRFSRFPTYAGEADNVLLLGGQRDDTGYQQLKLKYDSDSQKTVFTIRNGSDVEEDISIDKWYRVIVYTKGGTSNRYTYLLSEDGTLIWSGRTFDSASIEDFSYGFVSSKPESSTDVEFVVDNLSLNVYSPEESLSFIHGTVENGSENIARNSEMIFTFNQELNPSSSVVVTDCEGRSVATSSVVMNSVFVNFNSLLNKEEVYTIDFSGVKNIENIVCDSEDISFTTESVHLIDSPVINGLTPSESKTNIEFTLIDPLGYPDFTGLAAAVVYDENGVMECFDIIELNNITTGVPVTKEFDVNVTTENCNKLKLIIFDTYKGIQPLAMQEVELIPGL